MIKILIVDDSIFVCNMISKILSAEDTVVTSVGNARAAYDSISREIPDLILLDVILPDADGYEVCTKLKEISQIKNVPIIFITSSSDEQSVIRAFEAGAMDYIVKPFSSAELKARVACNVENKLMADQLRIANIKLKKSMEEVRQQGYKDPLTNLYNRRYFLEEMGKWRQRINEINQSVYLMLIDVDKFKEINDTYGHTTGDYVLFTVADILQRSVDERAIVGRWGGDEFLILIFGIDAEETMDIARFLLRQVTAYPFVYDGEKLSCSITVGAAQFHPELKIEENLNLADKALYVGKNRGRGCCVGESEIE